MEKHNHNHYSEVHDHNHEHGHDHGHDNEHGHAMTTIYVNDKSVLIHKRNQTVATIKQAANIPSTDVLYLMPHYETALQDTETITIKGGERFKSPAPSGSSS